MEKLQEIEARADKATRPPWSLPSYQRPDWETQAVPVMGGTVDIPTTLTNHPRVLVTCADAVFIAKAREDVPALCRALRVALAWSEHVPSECDPEDLCDPCEMRAVALAELSK